MRWLVLLLVPFTFGCPDVRQPPAPTVCEKAYEKCKLPDGPLGVCDRRPCKSGEPEPCLVCVSQH